MAVLMVATEAMEDMVAMDGRWKIFSSMDQITCNMETESTVVLIISIFAIQTQNKTKPLSETIGTFYSPSSKMILQLIVSWPLFSHNLLSNRIVLMKLSHCFSVIFEVWAISWFFFEKKILLTEQHLHCIPQIIVTMILKCVDKHFNKLIVIKAQWHCKHCVWCLIHEA